MRLLLVEDEAGLARALARGLAAEGFAVDVAGDGASGLQQAVDEDYDVIVLGGGLSNMAHLYEQVPGRMAPYVFSDVAATPVVRNRHGDSSGVRGAAWLWG